AALWTLPPRLTGITTAIGMLLEIYGVRGGAGHGEAAAPSRPPRRHGLRNIALVWAVQLRRHHAWFAHDLANCITAANENPALPALSVNVYVTKETVAAPGDAAVSGRSAMELHAGRPTLAPALAAAVANTG